MLVRARVECADARARADNAHKENCDRFCVNACGACVRRCALGTRVPETAWVRVLWTRAQLSAKKTGV